MRKSFFVLLVFLLAVPAVASAALLRRAGDGELSVDSGRGKVMVEARGGVIGRFADGEVQILDLTPDDIFVPTVFGDELPPRDVTTGVWSGAVVYRGTNVRFRLVGGRYRILVKATGIALTAVGNGRLWLESDGSRSPGTYSLDGDDCRLARVKCKPLPELRTWFKLGTVGEEKSSTRTTG